MEADFYQSQVNEDNIKDQDNETPKRKCGRPRRLTVIDEFFLVMCRLRRGFAEHHIAHLFGVSRATVS